MEPRPERRRHDHRQRDRDQDRLRGRPRDGGRSLPRGAAHHRHRGPQPAEAWGGAVEFSGDQYLERTIEFNGETYTVGSRVVSDLELKSARFGWIWQWAHDEDGKVAFGTVLEAKAFSVDAALAAPEYLPPIDESEKLDAIVPTIGFRLDVTPHPMVAIFAEATGMSAGDYGKILDAEVGLRFKPAQFISITAGYRLLDIEAKDDPDYLNFKLSGPYLGLNFHF